MPFDFYAQYYSPSDLETYGAEDYEELHSILTQLDRQSDREISKGAWQLLLDAPRHPVSSLSIDKVPTEPGVYLWMHDGEGVYIGMAGGRRGLRGRLRAHLATTPDLSRSTLRASVAVEQLGVLRSLARSRPTKITELQVDVVNRWLRQCQLSWIECPDAETARALETTLRRERMPRLNRQ